MDQVIEAYMHLHDLDWLQECDLARLPEILEMANPQQVMPEAHALRGALIEAAKKVIIYITSLPDKRGPRMFLEMYLEGRNLTYIARETGVSRNWVRESRRPEAFRLAGMQFVRDMSIGVE